jgi:hypothetical protein
MAGSTYFTRTDGTPTSDGTKATVSFWVKPSQMPSSGEEGLFEIRDASITSSFDITWSNGRIWYGALHGSWVGSLIPYAKFDDSSAWYHIVAVYDSAQSTDYERMILYVNGKNVRTDYGGYSTSTYVAQDKNLLALSTSGYVQNWGRYAVGSAILDGYMAQCVYVDGAVYQASTFGSTDATTGEWKPKSDGEIRSAVTFGDQGCLLSFQNASYPGYDYQTSDRSGTTNDYAKSGSGYQTQDNPSNNFVTLNSHFASTGSSSSVAKTLTYANLAGYPAGNNGLAANMGASKGKWYWEARPVAAYAMMGIMSGSASGLGTYDADYANGFTTYGGNKAIMVGTAGSYLQLMNVTTSDTSWGTALNESTDVLGVAVDLDNNNIYFSVNGVWQNSGVPTSGATGTGAVAITVQTGFPPLGEEVWLPAMNTFSGSATVQFNFGQGYFATTSVGATNADDAGLGVFKYDVPAGYYALCTKNLKTYG